MNRKTCEVVDDGQRPTPIVSIGPEAPVQDADSRNDTSEWLVGGTEVQEMAACTSTMLSAAGASIPDT